MGERKVNVPAGHTRNKKTPGVEPRRVQIAFSGPFHYRSNQNLIRETKTRWIRPGIRMAMWCAHNQLEGNEFGTLDHRLAISWYVIAAAESFRISHQEKIRKPAENAFAQL